MRRVEFRMKKNKLARQKIERADQIQKDMGVERCMNPWNGVCKSTDIALYLYNQGEKKPICKHCWIEISSKDVEWSYD